MDMRVQPTQHRGFVRKLWPHSVRPGWAKGCLWHAMAWLRGRWASSLSKGSGQRDGEVPIGAAAQCRTQGAANAEKKVLGPPGTGWM